MNIMVYDVAAETGGATSILNYFYEQHKQDKANHYYYVLSTYQLPDTDNITVINVPEVKNGWLSRLRFDYFGVKKYLSKYQIDEVFSLQNTIIPCFKGRQTVYEHNALPFAEYRFSLKESKIMWVYQNIIGRFMLSSIAKAERVIVQTTWMKEAIIKRVPKARDKIEVQFPQLAIPEGFRYQQPDKCVFFYPANSSRFKNHRLILRACLQLQERGIHDYSVAFTLNGDETEEIQEIRRLAEEHELDFHWIGSIPRDEVFRWYAKSVLVFPSYIETIGLPIYEAKAVGAPMLLSSCQYARDVAGDYPKAFYYDYTDADALASYMQQQVDACCAG